MTHEDRVRRVVVDHLGVTVGEVNLDSRLYQELRCDSLDIVGIVIDLEREFGVAITDDDAGKVSTVRDLVLLVDRLVAAQTLLTHPAQVSQ